MEHGWGESKPAHPGHDQTNGIHTPDRARQVQGPHHYLTSSLPPSPSPSPFPSSATTINAPYERGPCDLPDDMNTGLNMQSQVRSASSTSDHRVVRSETNPFKRKPVQRSSDAQNVAQNAPNEPTSMVPEPPTEVFSTLQLDEQAARNTNPWQSALSDRGSDFPPTVSLPLDQTSEKAASVAESELGSQSSALISSGSTEEIKSHSYSDPAPVNTLHNIRSPGDVKVMGKIQHGDQEMPAMALQSNELPDTINGRNVVGRENNSEFDLDNLPNHSGGQDLASLEDDTAQGVVARDTQEATLSSTAYREASPPRIWRRQSRTNANMSETYQIKKINWHDANAAENPRNSPILVQNANGPCPLVALVNALILTTPAARTNTELVETLRTRERISLKFLLDLVVDELMSFRHTESNIPLPDMSELYTFLQGLHTGMNVNPRFMPPSEAGADETHTRSSDVDIPGTFEKTRDIELYATFSIPLIHGWLPSKADPAYNALRARASSYDDAQNLLFREEELEVKFSNSATGLTEQEQRLYHDIIAIKTFLSMTATQLTPSGLNIITKSIKPGGVSILFRNDHFSTLYRHPQTLKLFSLVTDAGFFTHEEVVWESLVDVRGELAEFVSGDFRPVGGTQHERAENNDDIRHNSGATATSSDGGRQTVQNWRPHKDGQNEPAPPAELALSQTEQEDRDLALALQLQEEEDERHRAEVAARRRESHLSAQVIEQQGRDGGQAGLQPRGGAGLGSTQSLPPPRGSSVNHLARAESQARNSRPAQQVRSLIPPRTYRAADDGLEEAPPSYEQAAKSSPYLPPSGHPSHPNSSPRTLNPRRGPMSTSRSSARSSTPTRARQSVSSVPATGSSGGSGKDRDCSVM
ncbi:hypothetical protein GGS21DRAFT_501008 [Xylaria nigripes]|nr:hypothetical protein GGS21DRAFT_501008 [Xylaria nigripes]